MNSLLSAFSPLDVDLVDAPLLATLYAATGLALLLVLLGPASLRRSVVTVIGAAVGAAGGWTLVWFVSDVWDPWGVSLSTGTRLWTAALGASLAVVALNLRGQARWRRGVAALAIGLCLLSAAAGINADVGQFPTLRVALGLASYPPLDVALAAAGAHDAQTATAHPDSATTSAGNETGVVGTVTIPATVSGFVARDALVYLPRAAQRPNPPALPVVEMLSGQPGSPSDIFTAGGLASILDTYALAHSGLAPIVVVPDQLGAPGNNPMCVDSALGNSASYLTVDVPAWIRSHLHVTAQRAGVETHLLESPGTAHDWHTVDYAWTTALPLIAARTALLAPTVIAMTR